MELDKNKVVLKSNEVNAYAWRFSKIVSTSIPFTKEQEFKLKSDLNIGIDKSNGKLFLSKLEFLTRDAANCYIELGLAEISEKMPRHLDDQNEYVQHKKYGYKYLEIHRGELGKSYINSIDERLIITFSDDDLFRFFTKMYVNFEIYATEYDNKLEIQELNKDKSFSPCELIIWGVYNKEVIYY